jgi:hypothetical protein
MRIFTGVWRTTVIEVDHTAEALARAENAAVIVTDVRVDGPSDGLARADSAASTGRPHTANADHRPRD